MCDGWNAGASTYQGAVLTGRKDENGRRRRRSGTRALRGRAPGVRLAQPKSGFHCPATATPTGGDDASGAKDASVMKSISPPVSGRRVPFIRRPAGFRPCGWRIAASRGAETPCVFPRRSPGPAQAGGERLDQGRTGGLQLPAGATLALGAWPAGRAEAPGRPRFRRVHWYHGAWAGKRARVPNPLGCSGLEKAAGVRPGFPCGPPPGSRPAAGAAVRNAPSAGPRPGGASA